MFNLAKATGADATENLATEALAAAIRLNPRPLLNALATRGFKRLETFDAVRTQVDLGCILVPAAKHADAVWQDSRSPEEPKDVRRMIASRFGRWRTFAIQHRAGFRCGVTMGLHHEADFNQISAVADEGPVNPWRRDPARWQLLGACEQLTRFGSHDAASGWFVERQDELAGAGMFTLIDRHRADNGSGNDSGNDSDEDAEEESS